MKECQFINKHRTWLSKWSIATRLPGYCGDSEELRWVGMHLSYQMLPDRCPAGLNRRLKQDVLNLSRDSLREVVDCFKFLRSLLAELAKEYCLPADSGAAYAAYMQDFLHMDRFQCRDHSAKGVARRKSSAHMFRVLQC